MSSGTKKSRTSPSGEEPVSLVVRELEEERLIVTVEGASLKNIPLEKRKKEASKPLFLARYE